MFRSSWPMLKTSDLKLSTTAASCARDSFKLRKLFRAGGEECLNCGSGLTDRAALRPELCAGLSN
eukprot:8035797-Alexandrium_andersonii.AAC.1